MLWLIFKPGMLSFWPHAWFLEIALVRALVYVCVCVRVSASEGINNQWCDIGLLHLVKKFYGFPLLLITSYDICRR